VPFAVSQGGQSEEQDGQDDGEEPGPDAFRDDAANVVRDF